MNSFIIKGDICHSTSPEKILTCENSYLICKDGKSAGIFNSIPEKFVNLPLLDYSGKIVMPGLIDLHVHASQYSYRATAMDLELLEWLNSYAFPEEAKFKSVDYAKKAYGIFAENLKKSATTRACIFATVHRNGTLALMDILEESGLICAVGKVNMDRNCPDIIRETTEDSAQETLLWLENCKNRYSRTFPIITPRFVPSCTDELLERLGKLMDEYDVPVQSHISENQKEIEWVSELCPWSEFYGDVYDRFGMLGGKHKSVMSHCIWPCEEELRRIRNNGVFIAHCPQSNMNVVAGIAPVRKYLEMGLKIGLGSDVAGGSTESIFRAMSDAIQVSKLRWRLIDSSLKPITADEAFYMGTKGGGEFFGKVGSFEEGYEFDCIVIDDSSIKSARELTTHERAERIIYLSNDRHIAAKFVAGKQII